LLSRTTQDNALGFLVTRAQLNTVKRLNERSAKERHLTIGRFHDFVEVLNDNDPRASMITGVWFGMTIGILPDGSSHS
jgi:hypothetical protein